MHTVVTDGLTLIFQRTEDGESWHSPMGRPFESAVAALRFMRDTKIDNLWIAEGLQQAVIDVDPTAWWADTTGYSSGTGIRRTAIFPSGGQVYKLHDARDDRWPGLAEQSAGGLAAALSDLRAALGTQIAISPATTALRLLRSILSARNALPQPYSLAIKPEARDLQFLRADRAPRLYLHAYDRNGAYLSAARNASYGAGAVSYASAEGARALWNHKPRPQGLWQLKDLSPLMLDAYRKYLPCGSRSGDGWYPNAAVEHIGEYIPCIAGYIAGAWVYQRTARTLLDWATTLASARTGVWPAHAGVVKVAATAAIGMFDHTRQDAAAQQWWYQPQWRAQIVAVNALTMARRIREVEAAGHDVIAAYVDALYVASDSPNPADVMALGASIGQYKRVGTYAGKRARELQASAATGRYVVRWLAELDQEPAELAAHG